MSPDGYQYTFDSTVEPDSIEDLVHLAILSTAALHGDATARLEARYALDPDRRTCVIESGTPLRTDLNRLFVGLAKDALGSDAFTVRGLKGLPSSEAVR